MAAVPWIPYITAHLCDLPQSPGAGCRAYGAARVPHTPRVFQFIQRKKIGIVLPEPFQFHHAVRVYLPVIILVGDIRFHDLALVEDCGNGGSYIEVDRVLDKDMAALLPQDRFVFGKSLLQVKIFRICRNDPCFFGRADYGAVRPGGLR